ncbi:MAG: S49 family peptidase [Candidatus Paceibacterota bacterium]|jgi:protease-4
MNRPIVQEVIRIILWGAVGLVAFAVGLWIWGAWHDEWSGYNASISVSDGYCNIAVVPIVGDIYIDAPTSDGSENIAIANADEVVSMVRYAEYDSNIVGILVRIDSLGGTPAASELIANTLKRSPLPVAAVIREYGTSGGYLAATGADTIFGSAFSDIGGIGITMSYLENWEKNAKDGLRFVPLASAPLKDYGNPDKPLTTAERAVIERDLKIYHEHFVKEVAENRNLSIEDVIKFADGSSMPGTLALENKLIDGIGDQESTRAWFATQLGITADEVIFCE